MDLDLWLGDRHVAHTTGVGRGAKTRIAYEPWIAEEYGSEVPLLSCSMPTPGASEPARARSYLEGLLPEGRVLAAAAARVREVRLRDGAPETSADVVALLSEYGRECAGAVVALPAGQGPSVSGRYEALTDAEISRIVRDLPERPLGTDLARGIRMSLGGAQDKLLLARFEGGWYEPLDGAASTHILKPATTWPHSAHNEALVLHLARACGLTAADSWVEQVEGVPVLATQRYDRQIDASSVRRLQQEDMCQALGVRPTHKYELGRPSGRLSGVLREWSARPSTELDTLFRQIVFRVVVGDADGHGKNYSLLLDGRHVRMAPLYDSLCTLLYAELDDRLAMPIVDKQRLGSVDAAALIGEARAMGLPERDARSAVDEVSASVGRGLRAADRSLTEGWPSGQIIDIIGTRLDRLAAGDPLGGTRRRTPGTTLDAATPRRPRPS